MTNENTEQVETAVEETEETNILEQPLPMDNEEEETEVEATETEEVTEEVAEEVEEESTEDSVEKPKKKISGFHRKRLRDKATIEAQQAEIDRLKSQGKPAEVPKNGEPNADGYEHGINDINYIRDMARFEGKQAYHQERQKEQVTNQQQKTQKMYQSAQENYMDSMDTAADNHSDFEEKVTSISTDRLDPNTQLAIMKHKNAGELAYYLGSNPEVYRKIESAHPVDAISMIGEIGTKLTPKAKKTQQTKMPKPVSTLGTSKVKSIGEYDGSQESFDSNHSIGDLD